MQNYFKRQIQLWGEETQTLLSTKKIAIIGAGGLGSSLAFALGSSGIGEIDIVDFDEVNIHNIHRQIAFTLEDIKKNKAQVNAQMIKKRSPYVKSTAYECDFEQWMQLQKKVDLIIDATDNLSSRVKIDQYAKKTNTPWIYGSVEAFHGQVCFFDNASFQDIFKINEKTPEGVATPMVMQIASFQANLALRYLADLPIQKDILYYFAFNKEGEFINQKFIL
ncbi:Sulfur carrier protein adenylyltransferase ThiF [hydrothermal vent metagenome]|uniref:Sulfur carrier protein adenylyltransferase ThiF n=1 Tax=hydrothermal vent metagenome TaxID=652676 RepID=A0A1W1D279_9ZZZZ